MLILLFNLTLGVKIKHFNEDFYMCQRNIVNNKPEKTTTCSLKNATDYQFNYSNIRRMEFKIEVNSRPIGFIRGRMFALKDETSFDTRTFKLKTIGKGKYMIMVGDKCLEYDGQGSYMATNFCILSNKQQHFSLNFENEKEKSNFKSLSTTKEELNPPLSDQNTSNSNESEKTDNPRFLKKVNCERGYIDTDTKYPLVGFNCEVIIN